MANTRSTPISQSLAQADVERFQALIRRRQKAYDEARIYRGKGQLVPSSLRDEMLDLQAELGYALERCRDSRTGVNWV